MKKILSTFAILLVLILPITAFGAEPEVPLLNSISFNNASIVGEFSSDKFDYEILLDGSSTTPTLSQYEATDGANVYVTYNSNQGINVDVKKGNLTSAYSFSYKYPDNSETISSNSKLMSLECDLCEVYPEISGNRTKYDLYIPSDMTDINFVAIPEDINATCSVPAGITLKAGQTMKLEVTVKASDESTTVYTFNIKRLDKTMEQVREEMEQEDFTSLVQGQLFYQKPAFKIIVSSVVGGVAVIVILVVALRKLIVKVEDIDEVEFFEFPQEEIENEENDIEENMEE